MKSSISIIAITISLSILIFNLACDKEEKPSDLTGCIVDKSSVGMKINPGGKDYTFVSEKGFRVDVKFESIRFTNVCMLNLYLEFWGINDNKTVGFDHETLSGKHIKDRKIKNRTLIFPDDTKITLVGGEKIYLAEKLYIIEKSKVHIINLIDWTYSTEQGQAAITKYDNAIPDGEASRWEFNSNGSYWYNDYEEIKPGERKKKKVDLGRTYPNNKIDDLYDDPDLSNT